MSSAVNEVARGLAVKRVKGRVRAGEGPIRPVNGAGTAKFAPLHALPVTSLEQGPVDPDG